MNNPINAFFHRYKEIIWIPSYIGYTQRGHPLSMDSAAIFLADIAKKSSPFHSSPVIVDGLGWVEGEWKELSSVSLLLIIIDDD